MRTTDLGNRFEAGISDARYWPIVDIPGGWR